MAASVCSRISAELLQSLGITRVGDLTCLDVIGIPVWFATRPNSRSLSVSQGKGLTHDAARLTAIMEAAETAVAEAPEAIVSRYGSYKDLVRGGEESIFLPDIAACRYDRFDLDRERAWVEGRSWRTGRIVHAPYELVGLDMRSDAPWDRDTFRISSVGIAAAFDFETARLNALLELVENDSIEPFETFGLAQGAYAPSAADRLEEDELGRALRMLERAGVEPLFFDLSARRGLPVAACIIPRPASGEEGPGACHSAGFACRLQPRQAALAALLEAVQSRLTHIAGSRDDIAESDYRPTARSLVRMPVRSLSEFCARPPAMSGLGHGGAFDAIVARLFRSGVPDLYVFELPRIENICVARVVAPHMRFAAPDGESFATPEMSNALLSRWLEPT